MSRQRRRDHRQPEGLVLTRTLQLIFISCLLSPVCLQQAEPAHVVVEPVPGLVDPPAQVVLDFLFVALCSSWAWAAFNSPMSCSARSIKVDRRVMALLSRSTGAATRGHQPHQPRQGRHPRLRGQSITPAPPKNQRKVAHPQATSLPPSQNQPPPRPAKPAAPARPSRCSPPPPTASPLFVRKTPPAHPPPPPLSKASPPGSGARPSPGEMPHTRPALFACPPAKKSRPLAALFPLFSSAGSALPGRRKQLCSYSCRLGGRLFHPLQDLLHVSSTGLVPSTRSTGREAGGQPVLHQGLRPALHHAEESFLLLVQVAAGAHPLPEPPVRPLPHPSKPQRPGRLHQHGPAEQRLRLGAVVPCLPRRTPGPAGGAPAPGAEPTTASSLVLAPAQGCRGQVWGSTGPRCRRTSTPAAGPKPGPGCSSPRRLTRRPGCHRGLIPAGRKRPAPAGTVSSPVWRSL